MHLSNQLAVLAHSASDEELQGVATTLCLCAAAFFVSGHRAVGSRVLGQAVAVIELRFAAADGEPVRQS
jgi:hypothetical protein